MIDPRNGVLIAGCALLGVLILAELAIGTGGEDAGLAAAPRTPGAGLVAALPEPKTDAAVATSLARPLFNLNRRPPSVSGGSVDATLSDKRLAGIVIEPQRRIAIFEIKGAKPLTVTEGDEVSGWRIEAIAPGQVSVRGPGGTMTLEPKLDNNGASVPVGEGAPPAAPRAGATAPAARPPVAVLNRRNPE